MMVAISHANSKTVSETGNAQVRKLVCLERVWIENGVALEVSVGLTWIAEDTSYVILMLKSVGMTFAPQTKTAKSSNSAIEGPAIPRDILVMTAWKMLIAKQITSAT